MYIMKVELENTIFNNLRGTKYGKTAFQSLKVCST